MTDAPGDQDAMTRRWWEPEDDWLPIAHAVFRFAITHSERWQSIKTLLQDDVFASGNLIPSIEDVEQFIRRREKADADLVDNETDPLSLYNLTTTLRDRAGARRAEIDLDDARFRFEFHAPAGGSAVVSYAPGDLALPVDIHLRLLDDTLKIYPRLLGDALLNQGNGLITLDDETAMRGAQRIEAIRSATDHVWNQLMRPAFSQLVSAGRVKLYAQVQSRTAQFQQLSAALCANLTVEHWQDGTAFDPEGARYYSIHASDSLPNISSPQVEVPADHRLGVTKSRRPGRQKGQGSFEKADQPLLSEMKELLTEKKATSPEEAAGMVAKKAHGSGTWESKKERLGKRYRKVWPELN